MINRDFVLVTPFLMIGMWVGLVACVAPDRNNEPTPVVGVTPDTPEERAAWDAYFAACPVIYKGASDYAINECSKQASRMLAVRRRDTAK